MVCLLTSGCRLGSYAWESSVSEPWQYSSYWHDKRARSRNRELAVDALEYTKAQTRAERDDFENEPFSPAHELGFVDGFADYLYAGGTGAPPPLPPRKFWTARYQGPDGYQAAIDWFHGYEHGAMAARASGIRDCLTVPVSDFLVHSTQPYAYGKSRSVPPFAENERTGSRPGSARHSSLTPYVTRLPPVLEKR